VGRVEWMRCQVVGVRDEGGEGPGVVERGGWNAAEWCVGGDPMVGGGCGGAGCSGGGGYGMLWGRGENGGRGSPEKW